MLFYIFTTVIYICLVQGQHNLTIIRQTRPLSSNSFDEIIINGAFDIFLSQTTGNASFPTVEIETTVDAQNQVIVEIINNHTLSIHINGSLMMDKNIYAYIRFDSPLRRYTIKGTGNTMTDDNGISNVNNDTFIFEHRGIANVALQLNVHQFEFYFTGTGNCRFAGQVREKVIFNSKGVGDINSLSLSTKEARISTTGIGILRVGATDDIQIEAYGISNVYYRLPQGKTPSRAISKGLGKITAIY